MMVIFNFLVKSLTLSKLRLLELLKVLSLPCLQSLPESTKFAEFAKINEVVESNCIYRESFIGVYSRASLLFQ